MSTLFRTLKNTVQKIPLFDRSAISTTAVPDFPVRSFSARIGTATQQFTFRRPGNISSSHGTENAQLSKTGQKHLPHNGSDVGMWRDTPSQKYSTESKNNSRLGIYQLLNRREKEFVNEHLKGDERSFIATIGRFLRSDTDIFFQVVPSNHPYKNEIKSLFTKIKERQPDTSFAEVEDELMSTAMKSLQKTRPADAKINLEFITLTRNQVENFMKDREESISKTVEQGNSVIRSR